MQRSKQTPTQAASALGTRMRSLALAVSTYLGLCMPGVVSAHAAYFSLFTTGYDTFPCALTGESLDGTVQSIGDTIWAHGMLAGFTATQLWPSGPDGTSPMFAALTLTCWDVQSPSDPLPALRYVLRLPRDLPFWLARVSGTGAIRWRWPQDGTQTVFNVVRIPDQPHVFALSGAHGFEPPASEGGTLYRYGRGFPMFIPFVPMARPF